MNQKVIFDQTLIQRYDVSGPRYTSYPTAAQFEPGFGEAEQRECIGRSNAESPQRPLSLYLHIPFCARVCYYCACNKIVTKNRRRAAPYLKRLHREIALQGELFDRSRVVDQLHWGGGTPTFISHEEMRALMEVTRRHFTLSDDERGEYGIEIDPREVDIATIALLRELGFNRMSLGVQDFDARVQRAVNRMQPETQTLGVLEAARREGFRSINLDLIYGLPHQSVESFGHTLNKVIAAGPDRLSVYNYAHLPEMFKTQRQIDRADLPSPTEKLDILQLTIERLTDAGYVYIGMDHFAKPDDELAVAQRSGTLHRNFQGYSTRAGRDLIGLGVTAIGMVGDSYSQNARTIEEYYERIDAGRLATMRGVAFSHDDQLRRAVITQLICHFKLDVQQIERDYAIDFWNHFSIERSDLDTLSRDGLIDVDVGGIRVLPRGRLLIRNVCMVFDGYQRDKKTQGFSKAI